MRKAAIWILTNIPVGKLAPYLFAFAIKAKRFKKNT